MRSDKTVNRFEVDLGVPVNGGLVNDIRSLMEGKSIIVSESNCRTLRRIAEIIDNEELLKKCYGFGKKGISVGNCIDRLKSKEEFGWSIEEELAFIASHFHELDTEELKELNTEIIESIVSHEDLCLRDEESLLEFISSLGEEYSFLYRYIECRFLSLEGIKNFISILDETNIDEGLWSSICRRLCCEVCDQKLSKPRFVCCGNKMSGPGRDFPYIEGHPFRGIIHEMTKQCGGNIHEKGVVNITSSGDQRNLPFQVANHGWNNNWCSYNEPNSWICFDFKDRSVALNRYTLKSNPYADSDFVSWVIEGSNDGSNWTTLDERNTRDLNGPGIVKTYLCSNDCSEFFHYIRMRQTGRNSINHDRLTLTNIEFFGRVRE
jgi:hypothetical protein